MPDNDILYWLWLADRCGVASKGFAKLIARFENPFEIYRLEGEEIEAIDFIGNRLKAALNEKSLEKAYSILKYCRKNSVDLISYGDSRYPTRLKMLEDPPAVLYCLGKFPDFDRRLCIGMVGTRKISAYGMELSYKIAYELASAQVCVVSGMALGVDAVAACGVLEAGGDTVAVLGCGIDKVYPKSHAKLHKAICKSGAVITEYPPHEEPYRSNFPKRNRIISGLCQGILLVEGNCISGAMITAEYAIAQGREVFALPGKVGESNSEGPNKLIKQGANMVLSAEDIILHFDFLYRDATDGKKLKYVKLDSDFQPKLLERYGVSTEVYFGGKSAVPPKGAVKTEPFELPKTVTEPTENDTAAAHVPDNSAQILASLDSVSVRVFELMPIDKPVSADDFLSLGLGVSEVMTAFTMLELNGLVTSLPGGTYVRK